MERGGGYYDDYHGYHADDTDEDESGDDAEGESSEDWTMGDLYEVGEAWHTLGTATHGQINVHSLRKLLFQAYSDAAHDPYVTDSVVERGKLLLGELEDGGTPERSLVQRCIAYVEMVDVGPDMEQAIYGTLPRGQEHIGHEELIDLLHCAQRYLEDDIADAFPEHMEDHPDFDELVTPPTPEIAGSIFQLRHEHNVITQLLDDVDAHVNTQIGHLPDAQYYRAPFQLLPQHIAEAISLIEAPRKRRIRRKRRPKRNRQRRRLRRKSKRILRRERRAMRRRDRSIRKRKRRERGRAQRKERKARKAPKRKEARARRRERKARRRARKKTRRAERKEGKGTRRKTRKEGRKERRQERKRERQAQRAGEDRPFVPAAPPERQFRQAARRQERGIGRGERREGRREETRFSRQERREEREITRAQEREEGRLQRGERRAARGEDRTLRREQRRGRRVEMRELRRRENESIRDFNMREDRALALHTQRQALEGERDALVERRGTGDTLPSDERRLVELEDEILMRKKEEQAVRSGEMDQEESGYGRYVYYRHAQYHASSYPNYSQSVWGYA